LEHIIQIACEKGCISFAADLEILQQVCEIDFVATMENVTEIRKYFRELQTFVASHSDSSFSKLIADFVKTEASKVDQMVERWKATQDDMINLGKMLDPSCDSPYQWFVDLNDFRKCCLDTVEELKKKERQEEEKKQREEEEEKKRKAKSKKELERKEKKGKKKRSGRKETTSDEERKLFAEESEILTQTEARERPTTPQHSSLAEKRNSECISDYEKLKEKRKPLLVSSRGLNNSEHSESISSSKKKRCSKKKKKNVTEKEFNKKKKVLKKKKRVVDEVLAKEINSDLPKKTGKSNDRDWFATGQLSESSEYTSASDSGVLATPRNYCISFHIPDYDPDESSDYCYYGQNVITTQTITTQTITNQTIEETRKRGASFPHMKNNGYLTEETEGRNFSASRFGKKRRLRRGSLAQNSVKLSAV